MTFKLNLRIYFHLNYLLDSDCKRGKGGGRWRQIISVQTQTKLSVFNYFLKIFKQQTEEIAAVADGKYYFCLLMDFILRGDSFDTISI